MKVSKSKKVEPVQPITRTQPTKRRETPYQGDIDPAVIIHSSKTHRTASEAFRDADYATAFWREKSEWEQSLEFLASAILGFMWVGVIAGLVGAVAYWLFFS